MTAAPTSAKISFDQFRLYSLAYLQHRDRLISTVSPSQLSWLTYAAGWRWLPALHPGSAFERTACLERSLCVVSRHSSLDTDEVLVEHVDEVVDQSESSVQQVVTVYQTISYSNIWRLPILHFSAYTETGQPVQIDKLRRFGVVHSTGSLQDERYPPQGDEVIDAQVIPLSVADHPRTGLPAYYLHPCNTEGALTALLQHVDGQQHNSQVQSDCAYIEVFVNLCASAVEMRAS